MQGSDPLHHDLMRPCMGVSCLHAYRAEGGGGQGGSWLLLLVALTLDLASLFLILKHGQELLEHGDGQVAVGNLPPITSVYCVRIVIVVRIGPRIARG